MAEIIKVDLSGSGVVTGVDPALEGEQGLRVVRVVGQAPGHGPE